MLFSVFKIFLNVKLVMSKSVSTCCCYKVDALTCSLPQSIRGDAWGHVGDGDDVALRGRCRGGGGAPILDLNGEESLHVRVFLFLGDLLSSCSPWGPVLLWVTVGVLIFFSRMPRPTHGVLRLASRGQRFTSPSSWLRCCLTLRCGRCVRCGISRCVDGCCCLCKPLSSSAEVCLATAASPIPQRSFLQSRDIWALAGLCELAHSITYRVGAVELFQYSIFLLRCCKDITEKRTQYIRDTKSLDHLYYTSVSSSPSKAL